MASNAASNEKVTFGLVVSPVEETEGVHDTSLHTPPTQHTPFYALPSAQPSLQSLPSKKEPNVAVYETDLEANHHLGSELATPMVSSSNLDLPAARPMLSQATTAMSGYRRSYDAQARDCTVWPTKETLREKAKAQKAKEQQRTWCGPMKTKWASLQKKQRLWIRILVFLVIVAFAVGLGVGITKAVHGGVWAGKGESHTIPNTPT